MQALWSLLYLGICIHSITAHQIQCVCNIVLIVVNCLFDHLDVIQCAPDCFVLYSRSTSVG